MNHESEGLEIGKMKRENVRLYIAVVMVAIGVLCTAALAFADTAPTTGPKDIVDTAIAAGNFKTLVAAVQAAGLVETLKGQGPFTVFAPTDEAFAKLPKEALDALLKDKAQLTSILTYHVVAGKVMAAQVVKHKSVKTVEGQSLKVRTVKGAVMIDNAKVVQTDIIASNGVIHVIDTVLMPSKKM
jgi:uncharacterized surface protein with fasciclin (FAS1) repeats